MKIFKTGLLASQIMLFRIRGIPVFINYGWIIVFILSSLLLALHLPSDEQNSIFFKSLFGVLASALFFLSVLMHEIAHAKVAEKEGIKVSKVILHPFGGLAVIEKEPEIPKIEFRVAIAGPMMSFLLATIFLTLLIPARFLDYAPLTLLFAFLFFCNFFLAIFNLFPGYPLDGGRILRAILWEKGMNFDKATFLSGKAGQTIAMALVFLGIMLILLKNDLITGLWFCLVGLFLWDPANKIVKDFIQKNKTLVKHIMKSSVVIPPNMLIAEFLNKILPMSSQKAFPVGKDGKLQGLLLLEDLKKMQKSEWYKKTVHDSMRVVQRNYLIHPEDLAMKAKDLIKRNGVGALVVIDENENIVGFLEQRSS